MALGNYQEAARAFQLQDSTVCKVCKAAPPEESESHQVFEEKQGKEMLKVQDVNYHTQLPQMKHYCAGYY